MSRTDEIIEQLKAIESDRKGLESELKSSLQSDFKDFDVVLQ